nr:MAG TPA: Sigma factor AlgU negative regulatory factor, TRANSCRIPTION.96A [Caudoviricetes sp.]
MRKVVKVCEFIEPELDQFRAICNFVGLEKDVFELRARGYSLYEMSDMLDVDYDTVKRTSQKVTHKIIKAIPYT